MTATATKPKTKAEKRGKAPPPDKANGKQAKPITDKETRILESWQRLEKIHQNYLEAREKLADAESELEDAKEARNTQQGNVDELNRKMHQVLDEIKNPSPIYAVAPLPNGNGKHAPEVKEDESWRTVTIRSAMPGIGKKFYEACDGAKLTTLGEFCDWRNKNQGANWVTDLPGVGKAAADKIDDALEAFLTKWRKENPPKPVATAEPSDKYEAIMSDPLHNFPTIIGDAALRAKLSDLKLYTVRDVFDRAKKDAMKPFDSLRAALGSMPDADCVWSAINARADEVAKSSDKPALKAGNGSGPAGAPLIDPRDIPSGVKTVEELGKAAEEKAGK